MRIPYPYKPEGKQFVYVPKEDLWMQEARRVALEESLDSAVKTGSVVVQDGRVIGRGANGSRYHEEHGCERVKRGIPTGQGYELCEGCHPKNHSERRAIADAHQKGHDTNGADLYLWGHWWACEPCWSAILDAGIKTVHLLEGSEYLFNKADPRNILGRWDEYQ
jgi:deoxycytidylate deaminase